MESIFVSHKYRIFSSLAHWLKHQWSKVELELEMEMDPDTPETTYPYPISILL